MRPRSGQGLRLRSRRGRSPLGRDLRPPVAQQRCSAVADARYSAEAVDRRPSTPRTSWRQPPAPSASRGGGAGARTSSTCRTSAGTGLGRAPPLPHPGGVFVMPPAELTRWQPCRGGLRRPSAVACAETPCRWAASRTAWCAQPTCRAICAKLSCSCGTPAVRSACRISSLLAVVRRAMARAGSRSETYRSMIRYRSPSLTLGLGERVRPKRRTAAATVVSEQPGSRAMAFLDSPWSTDSTCRRASLMHPGPTVMGYGHRGRAAGFQLLEEPRGSCLWRHRFVQLQLGLATSHGCSE